MAQSLSLPFLIVSVEAPVHIMKLRVRSRAEKESDPSEANEEVLMAQLRNHDCLTQQESQYVKIIDNSDRVSDKELEKISDIIRQDVNDAFSDKDMASLTV